MRVVIQICGTHYVLKQEDAEQLLAVLQNADYLLALREDTYAPIGSVPDDYLIETRDVRSMLHTSVITEEAFQAAKTLSAVKKQEREDERKRMMEEKMRYAQQITANKNQGLLNTAAMNAAQQQYAQQAMTNAVPSQIAPTSIEGEYAKAKQESKWNLLRRKK